MKKWVVWLVDLGQACSSAEVWLVGQGWLVWYGLDWAAELASVMTTVLSTLLASLDTSVLQQEVCKRGS